MNLYTMLEKRAEEGNPVRVGLIGAGKFGAMFLTQAQRIKGLKIVGIADSFDALTTQRIYQTAVETYPALQIMFKQSDTFDRKLLEKFALLMGPAEATGI